MSEVIGSKRAIITWLLVVCVTIFAMVVVGGVTRLTHSGLSMVEWQPIMGVIPPLGQEEWQETFEVYKQYPEYQQINQRMNLQQFKSIFYWEYGHRLLGRLIGVIFFLPFVIFWWQKRFAASLKRKLTIVFLLGGLQGLMGWYMVMSGLVDVPRVSHYRLAAHLSLALILLGYIFWIVLDLSTNDELEGKYRRAVKPMRLCAIAVLVLISVQIVYGAFTAGLRAGFGYNTFPLMNGQWMADAVGSMSPLWLNLFESTATVQFIHRYLGMLVVLFVLVLWVWGMRSDLGRPQKIGLHLLWGIAAIQFLLGVLTLILVVPIGLASLHQAVACLLVIATVYVVHSLWRRGELSGSV
jgi:cytochrome c oxidase assembly protein subunit 15|tara:strand:+ start:1010 stop:2068 length:1059 start_codon:yes stop_codon:yes gene_type:complete